MANLPSSLLGSGSALSISGGTGDVQGSGVTTDNAVARWSGAGGVTIQNSGVIVDDSNNVSGVVALSATGAIKGLKSISNNAASPVTVNASDSGTVYTNTGAGGAITFNLPTAVAGYIYTFVVDVAQNVVVKAAAADTIRVAAGVSSANGTATNGTIGSVIVLVAINATEWMAISTQGTWTLA